MPGIAPSLVAAVVFLAAGTEISGTPAATSTAPDPSFCVFFDPGTASLSKEGREILAVAAKRFAAAQSHQSIYLLVSSETGGRGNTFLSSQRLKAVVNALTGDGVQKKFVIAYAQPAVGLQPVRLAEWQDRRVSISIQHNPVPGRTVG